MNFFEKVNKPKLMFWSFIVGLSLGFTPFMFLFADLERGYDGIGGELFTPFFPIVLFLAIDWIKGLKEDFTFEL